MYHVKNSHDIEVVACFLAHAVCHAACEAALCSCAWHACAAPSARQRFAMDTRGVCPLPVRQHSVMGTRGVYPQG